MSGGIPDTNTNHVSVRNNITIRAPEDQVFINTVDGLMVSTVCGAMGGRMQGNLGQNVQASSRAEQILQYDMRVLPFGGRRGGAARSVAILLHAGGPTEKFAKCYLRSGSIDINEIGKDR